MGIRLNRKQHNSRGSGEYFTELTDPITIDTYHDGMKFSWGPNQQRNFADDGVGKGHAAHHSYVAAATIYQGAFH